MGGVSAAGCRADAVPRSGNYRVREVYNHVPARGTDDPTDMAVMCATFSKL